MKVTVLQILRPMATAAACLCLLMLTGCTSFQTVTIATPSATGSLVEPGDRVRVTHLDRRTSEFKVTQATATGLEGREISVPLSDISQLEVRKFDRRKTWALIGGIGGAALAVAAVYAYGQSKLNDEVWNGNP